MKKGRNKAKGFDTWLEFEPTAFRIATIPCRWMGCSDCGEILPVGELRGGLRHRYSEWSFSSMRKMFFGHVR